MAAKQGLTAQIYQASEDTKRAVLSRAPAGIKSHSWLSNLNTTCTIKSAPPRTPEVMSLLSTKCGWLVKRNEQHVWQKRWCCVVPHTFLYYFEAPPEVRSDEDGCHEGWSGGGVNVNGKLTVVVPFQNLDQDALNVAVRDGYEEDGGEARTSFYASLPNFSVVGGVATGTGDPNNDDALMNGVASGGIIDLEDSALITGADAANNAGTYQFASSSNLQPVGIIDLECYSAVNRSKINPTVLELAGDAITNPDLRSFYFQSVTIEDAESWTKALLSDRHQSLKDETDAYRQVCDSFPLQLQACSDMIDAAEAKAEDMEREAYSVRSAAEEERRKVVATVREMLERKCWETKTSHKSIGSGRNGIRSHNNTPFGDDHSVAGSRVSRSGRSDISRGSKHSTKEDSLPVDSVLDVLYAKLETNRASFIKELEAALSSPSAVATSNVVPPVQTLVDYTSAIIGSFPDLRVQLRKYEKDLRNSVEKDQSQLETLRDAIEGRDMLLADAEKKHSVIVAELKSELEASQREVEELSKQLDAHRMEFGMYQNATKTKLSELQQHKKILKREVIDLRKKIDELGSENTTVAHEYEKIKGSFQAEKERNGTLERYIERLEKQVGVQQNMMEMMSQGGGASVLGKIVGPGVTNSESKDAISLSGMSMNSQQRRICSNDSVGGGGTTGGIPSSSLKPRPLLTMPLPPGSSRIRAQNDISPLPTPTFFKDSDRKDTDNEGNDEERNLPSAFYPSECSSEGGSSRSANENISPSGQSNAPSIINNGENAIGGDGAASIPSSSQNGSTEEKVIDPATPDENNDSLNTSVTNNEPIKTPVQSNSVSTSSIFNGVTTNIVKEDTRNCMAMDMPTLEVKAKEPTDERMKIVSINDRFLSASNIPATDVDRDEDDTDDNKSRVSDITEDRTQRQIDDDLAERRKILLAYVSSAGGSSNVSMSMSSTQRRLDTIENIIPNNRGNASRVGVLEEQSVSMLSMGSFDSGSRSDRLSIAQRSRIEAESRSNIIRAASTMKPKDAQPVSFPKINRAPSTSSVDTPPSRGGTIEHSGSFFSKLGRAIENAVDKSVLGVKITNEDGYDYDDDDDASETTTTLQERITKQREKQVAFLKRKGLLDDESSLRGGAGGSVTSSPKTTPRRGATARMRT